MISIKRLKMAAFSAISLISVAGAAPAAAADNYPSKPVKIVVGYQPGGPTDLLARIVAERLQADLGQPFVVENKPGVASNIASQEVARAKPDGYTLLMAAAPIATNQFMYKNVGFDVLKDFQPISQIMSAPSVLVVSKQLGFESVEDVIERGKSDSRGLTVASTGFGGTPHLASEFFIQRTGIKTVHVPYKGQSSAVTDVMAGHVDMYFITSLSAIPYLSSGNPQPLAVLAKQRMPQLPDVPTLAETSVGELVAESWTGLFAPAGTPRPIVDKLHASMAKIIQDPAIHKELTEQGAIVTGSESPAAFEKFVQHNVEMWGEILKTAQIEPL